MAAAVVVRAAAEMARIEERREEEGERERERVRG